VLCVKNEVTDDPNKKYIIKKRNDKLFLLKQIFYKFFITDKD